MGLCITAKSDAPPTLPYTRCGVASPQRFFGDYLGGNEVFGQRRKVSKVPLKAFIAQLATGEGKSIVIAMMAIFMVKIYGMRVHVLENNEGLLERDYATNAPFYSKFDIKSGKDIGNEETQICYCLKQAINKHFLKRMVVGKLDEDLRRTVLIVDEVDDLIVNEKPTAHYVKEDVLYTPEYMQAYTALKVLTMRSCCHRLPQFPSAIRWCCLLPAAVRSCLLMPVTYVGCRVRLPTVAARQARLQTAAACHRRIRIRMVALPFAHRRTASKGRATCRRTSGRTPHGQYTTQRAWSRIGTTGSSRIQRATTRW